MADDETSVSHKEMLEIQKLQIEIRKLRRPWWSEPSYISAFLPTMIALTSLLIVWRTGFLDAKSLNLDTKKTKLEVDVRDFEARQTDLGITNTLLRNETERLKGAKANLDNHLRQLQANVTNLVVQRDEATSARDVLRMQNADLQREQVKLVAVAESERRAARLAPVREMLRDFRNPASVYRLPVGGINVIKHLRNDPSLRPIYIAEIEHHTTTADPKIRAMALQAEALGTGDSTVTTRLIDEVSHWLRVNKSSQDYPQIVSALDDSEVAREASVGWSDSERDKVLSLAATTLEDEGISPAIRLSFLYLVASSVINSNYVVHNTNPTLAVRLIRAARAVALDKGAEISAREGAFTVLNALSPAAFVVVASYVFTDSSESDIRVLVAIERALPYLTYRRAANSLNLDQPLRRDSALWTKWRSEHGAIVTLWSGTMDELERNPHLVRPAIEVGLPLPLDETWPN